MLFILLSSFSHVIYFALLWLCTKFFISFHDLLSRSLPAFLKQSSQSLFPGTFPRLKNSAKWCRTAEISTSDQRRGGAETTKVLQCYNSLLALNTMKQLISKWHSKLKSTPLIFYRQIHIIGYEVTDQDKSSDIFDLTSQGYMAW